MEAIVGRLTGREFANTKLVYTYNYVTLGRRDGMLQTVDDEGQAKPKYQGGRTAALVKEGINRIALWTISHPTFGLPKRRHRLAAAPDTSRRAGGRVAA
jgi:NADH dehydrogenase